MSAGIHIDPAERQPCGYSGIVAHGGERAKSAYSDTAVCETTVPCPFLSEPYQNAILAHRAFHYITYDRAITPQARLGITK